MVSRQQRDVAALVLRQFLDGSITNDDFMSQFPVDEADRALRAIQNTVWSHFSDLSRHTLTGKHALGPDARALLERCYLFLTSDLDFKWPTPKISLAAGMLQFVGLGWLVRRYNKSVEHLGDSDIWPFLEKNDHEAHLSTQVAQGKL